MTQLFFSVDQLPSTLHAAALAVGNFDGVHRGHAKLIAKLVEVARCANSPALVMTFDPPPQAVLAPERVLPNKLTTIARRAELLYALGVDALIAYPTDAQLLALSPGEFFQRIVVGKLRARAMVEGPNFRFGYDRAGDTELLGELCRANDMAFEVAEATTDAQGMISSTRIRQILAAGDISTANDMLTEPYELRGLVSTGAKRGRELGFPTANLADIGCFIPAAGVYAGTVTLDGTQFPAAVNIGPNPTFAELQSKVEVHVVGWSGSLYGTSLACSLVQRIRDVRKFDSIDALRSQIKQDVATCVRCCEQPNPQ